MHLSESIINDGNMVVEPPEPKDKKAHPAYESAVLHRSLHHEPLHVVGAKGSYLRLSNGQEIFDATGGAAVSCLGHGNKR